MPKTTITSRAFNQDLAAAKRAASASPVFITDRGEPAFVLMAHSEYQQLAKRSRISLLDALASADTGVDLQIPEGAFYNRILRFD